MVPLDSLEDLRRGLRRVNPLCCLLEPDSVLLQVRTAHLEQALDRDLREVLRIDHPRILRPAEGEVRLDARLELSVQDLHEPVEFRLRHLVRPENKTLHMGGCIPEVFGQLPRVRIEDSPRGHLAHLVERVGEAAIQGRAEVLQKPRDIGLQLCDRPHASVERRVVPQQVIHDIHSIQGVGREGPRPSTILDVGKLGQEHPPEDAELELRVRGEAVPPGEPIEGGEVPPDRLRKTPRGQSRVDGQPAIVRVQAGRGRERRVEPSIVAQDLSGELRERRGRFYLRHCLPRPWKVSDRKRLRAIGTQPAPFLSGYRVAATKNSRLPCLIETSRNPCASSFCASSSGWENDRCSPRRATNQWKRAPGALEGGSSMSTNRPPARRTRWTSVRTRSGSSM